MLKYWREILLVLLIAILSFISGRGFESNYVQQLQEQNLQLRQIHAQTENLLRQISWNAQAIQTWTQLGYNVITDSMRLK